MPRNRAARNTLCRHPEAEPYIAIKRAESQRAAAVAKAQADQERVAAETASLPKQAEPTTTSTKPKPSVISSSRVIAAASR